MSEMPCIVGLGALTSIGTSAPMSAASVRAGIVRFAEHPWLVDVRGHPVVAAAASIPPELTGADRFMALVLPALEEVLAPLGTGVVPPCSGFRLLGRDGPSSLWRRSPGA